MAAYVRARVRELMEKGGLSLTGTARQAGLDRSTLSQLLSGDEARLPSVDTLARLAGGFQVSMDWLVGIRAAPDDGVAVMDTSTTVTGGEGPENSPMARWYLDARGHKIRYLPANLPDLLKMEAVSHHEYGRQKVLTARQAEAHNRSRLVYQRLPETDMECCTRASAITDFAEGRGIWQDVDKELRRAQLNKMAALLQELYPTFRWFVYEDRRFFVPPMTIFGVQRVAFYVGSNYLVLTNPAQVRHFIGQFDGLIREAVRQPTEMPDFLRSLAENVT